MSKRQVTREHLTHFVIALSVVAGGYMFLVEPQKKRFDRTEARIQELRAQAEEATEPTTAASGDISRRLAQLHAVASEIETGNRPYLDATRLYEDITALAEERQLELGPFSPKHRDASKEAPAALTLRLIATGTYEDLADFAMALEYETGFSRILEFSARPFGDRAQPMVRATIQVEFLKFEMPESLVSLVEGQNAEH